MTSDDQREFGRVGGRARHCSGACPRSRWSPSAGWPRRSTRRTPGDTGLRAEIAAALWFVDPEPVQFAGGCSAVGGAVGRSLARRTVWSGEAGRSDEEKF